MNSLESHLSHPFGDTMPDTGAALAVAPSVHWRSAAVPLMFRRALDVHQLYFSIEQALVHFGNLWQNRIVRREIDSEGIIRFRVMQNKLPDVCAKCARGGAYT